MTDNVHGNDVTSGVRFPFSTLFGPAECFATIGVRPTRVSGSSRRSSAVVRAAATTGTGSTCLDGTSGIPATLTRKKSGHHQQQHHANPSSSASGNPVHASLFGMVAASSSLLADGGPHNQQKKSSSTKPDVTVATGRSGVRAAATVAAAQRAFSGVLQQKKGQRRGSLTVGGEAK